MSKHLSRRRLLAGSALMAGTGVLARPGLAQNSLRGTGSVIVHFGGGSMGNAQRIAYSEPFERETGIRVIHQAGVNAGVQRAATLAGAPKHDVANISGGSMAAFEQDNLLQPIDYGYWSERDRAAFDVVPAATNYVPAMLYSMITAYDSAALCQSCAAELGRCVEHPGLPRSADARRRRQCRGWRDL